MVLGRPAIFYIYKDEFDDPDCANRIAANEIDLASLHLRANKKKRPLRPFLSK